DDRDVFSGGELLDQLRGAARFIVLVIADERFADLEVLQQMAGVSRVFAGDQIDAFQDFERAERNVTEVADGSGDEVEQGKSEVRGQKRRQRLRDEVGLLSSSFSLPTSPPKSGSPAAPPYPRRRAGRPGVRPGSRPPRWCSIR